MVINLFKISGWSKLNAELIVEKTVHDDYELNLNHDDDDNNDSIRTSITMTVIKEKNNKYLSMQVRYLSMVLSSRKSTFSIY